MTCLLYRLRQRHGSRAIRRRDRGDVGRSGIAGGTEFGDEALAPRPLYGGAPEHRSRSGAAL